MATTGIAITLPVSGDDFDLTINAPDVPSGQTIAKAWLTGKTGVVGVDDTGAIFQKIITPSLVPGEGQVTDTGAGGTGQLLFTLEPTDTRAILAAGEPVSFDVQILTNLGKTYTLITESTITVHPEVTMAQS